MTQTDTDNAVFTSRADYIRSFETFLRRTDEKKQLVDFIAFLFMHIRSSLPHFKDGFTVTDIGCGNGQFSFEAWQTLLQVYPPPYHSIRYIGIDILEEHVQKTKSVFADYIKNHTAFVEQMDITERYPANSLPQLPSIAMAFHVAYSPKGKNRIKSFFDSVFQTFSTNGFGLLVHQDQGTGLDFLEELRPVHRQQAKLDLPNYFDKEKIPHISTTVTSSLAFPMLSAKEVRLIKDHGQGDSVNAQDYIDLFHFFSSRNIQMMSVSDRADIIDRLEGFLLQNRHVLQQQQDVLLAFKNHGDTYRFLKELIT